jgi:putative FmdB family regulatory protein
MPIYEYLCDKCEREFEVEQRITEDPIRSCPHCRSRKVRRLISQTSFVLKGSGWYSDLYSSSKSKSEGDAKDTGGDAKPASDASPSAAAATSDSKSSSPSKDSKDSKDTKGPGPGGKGKSGGKGKKSDAKAAA